MDRPALSILRIMSPLCGVVTFSLLVVYFIAWSRQPYVVDDAFMFYRYAENLARDGVLAWNPDGPPTYGLTSLGWVLVILPATFLPVPAIDALGGASWLTGIVALAVMGMTVSRFALTPALKSPLIAVAAVAVPLLIGRAFPVNLLFGMDTMLSLLANAGVMAAALAYEREPTARHAGSTAVMAIFAIVARPENGLAAIAVPGLTALTRSPRPRDLAIILLLPLGFCGLAVLVASLYFGVALPLGFYAKSLHAYAGFQNQENALLYLFLWLGTIVPYIGLLAAGADRRSLRRAVLCLLPVLATIAYLLTVRQIMGFWGRYYLPFTPYLALPALLAADAAFVRDPWRAHSRATGAIVALTALVDWSAPLQAQAAQAFSRHVVAQPLPVPVLKTPSALPLPRLPRAETIALFGDRIMARLPPGVTVAATEVGYIGVAAPTIPIIDLAGLNDTAIALHGLSMDDLLDRAPDLIWFPETDYTGLRATLFSESRLVERYVVIRDAFSYGIAIRRDSPARAAIEALVADAWRAAYPGCDIRDYTIDRLNQP